jgi:glycosyltransferase involved in cell wall biosynthesis
MTPPIVPHRAKPHQGRRLLLISPYPPSRTGPAEYAQVFATQCAARGFEVRILAERVEGAPPPAPNAAFVVDPVWTRSRAGISRLYAAARDDPAEVIHVNYSFTMYGGLVPGLLALFELARLRRERPVVVTLFDVLPKRELTSETLALYHIRSTPTVARWTVGLILRFLTRVADRIVVQTDATRQVLVGDYGVPASKVAITELPGYPAPAASTVPGAKPVPSAGAPSGPPTILYFGYLAPYKGVETLLAAYARARATAPDRPLRLVIAGTNHPRLPSDFAGTLVEEARRLRLDPGEVSFVGYVPDEAAPKLFADASLVVLPYLKTAGASGTLASAMGADRPVVVSDLPNLVSQLNGYAKSRVLKPGDVGDLADTLRSVAEGKFVARPPRASSPGATHRWEDLVDRTADIYSTAIAERRRDFRGFRGAGSAEPE